MNLLAKIRLFGALILGLILFNSCEERDEFGLNSDDVAPVEFLTEQIPISSAIVALDSINTSRIGLAMVGRLNDPQFGQLDASSYLAFSLNELNLPSLTEDAVLDSAKLAFSVSYLYDSSLLNRRLSISAFEIGEEFIDTTYISTSTLINSGNLLALGTVNVVDLDSIYQIDLNNTWANSVVQGLIDEDAAFETEEAFVEFFRGLVLTAQSSTFNMFGLLPRQNFDINIYYTDLDEEGNEVNGVVNFDTGSRPYFFNVNTDRSASRISEVIDIQTAYDQPEKRVVQCGAGLVTKLDLSGLEGFSTEHADDIVNFAEIEIGPIDELITGDTPPVALFLYLTDKRNSLIRDRERFRSIQEDGFNVLGTSSTSVPVILFYDEDTRTYKASVTSYVQAYLANEFRRNEVFLYPADMSTSVNTLVVDPSDINLNIFYSQLR